MSNIVLHPTKGHCLVYVDESVKLVPGKIIRGVADGKPVYLHYNPDTFLLVDGQKFVLVKEGDILAHEVDLEHERIIAENERLAIRSLYKEFDSELRDIPNHDEKQPDETTP